MIARVWAQEMLINSSALILKWLNAGTDYWTHSSTLSGNDFPNRLFSRVSLHIRLCRSVSGCRLCKTGSRKASLEFCERREQRWPLTADEKISHEKNGGMDRSRCQTVITRETEVGGGGYHMIKMWDAFDWKGFIWVPFSTSHVVTFTGALRFRLGIYIDWKTACVSLLCRSTLG